MAEDTGMKKLLLGLLVVVVIFLVWFIVLPIVQASELYNATATYAAILEKHIPAFLGIAALALVIGAVYKTLANK